MGERVADLEEELQQASLVIVELEDELAKKNRLLAEHVRPPTPHPPLPTRRGQLAARRPGLRALCRAAQRRLTSC